MVMARRGTYSSPKKSLAASMPGDPVQGDQPGAAVAAGAGLVEADVAGATDAQDLEVDPAGGRDGLLVASQNSGTSLGGDRAVGDVDVLGGMSTWSKRYSCMNRW